MKCDQYWPSRGSQMYGVMHVTLLDVVELATYTIRTFLVARASFHAEFYHYRIFTYLYVAINVLVYAFLDTIVHYNLYKRTPQYLALCQIRIPVCVRPALITTSPRSQTSVLHYCVL